MPSRIMEESCRTPAGSESSGETQSGADGLRAGVYDDVAMYGAEAKCAAAEARVTPRKDLHATSVERAFAILEFLDGSRRGWNISELSRKLRIPKSTTHVIVLTLARLGYLT